MGRKRDVLRPCDRFTSVLPTLRFSNIEGALISYQSGAYPQWEGRVDTTRQTYPSW